MLRCQGASPREPTSAVDALISPPSLATSFTMVELMGEIGIVFFGAVGFGLGDYLLDRKMKAAKQPGTAAGAPPVR